MKQEEGVAWMDHRGCVSCHQVPFMLWSLSAAQAAGFDVDEGKLTRWQRWSIDPVNFVQPDQKADIKIAETLASNIDTMNALLLAGDADAEPTWRQSFVDALIENQQDDATWRACGQLPAQKRPGAETTRVTTLWTLLALAREQQRPREFERAIESVDQGEDAVSTEWWVARLLLASELEEPSVERYRQALWQRQRDDGGWGWLSDEPSDALATGMAIYALSSTNRSGEPDQRLQRAANFLTMTQQPDGSWEVPGTKKSTRQRATDTSSYWGTAWAVIGLLIVREQ